MNHSIRILLILFFLFSITLSVQSRIGLEVSNTKDRLLNNKIHGNYDFTTVIDIQKALLFIKVTKACISPTDFSHHNWQPFPPKSGALPFCYDDQARYQSSSITHIPFSSIPSHQKTEC